MSKATFSSCLCALGPVLSPPLSELPAPCLGHLCSTLLPSSTDSYTDPTGSISLRGHSTGPWPQPSSPAAGHLPQRGAPLSRHWKQDSSCWNGHWAGQPERPAWPCALWAAVKHQPEQKPGLPGAQSPARTVGRGVDSPEVQVCTGAIEGHVTSQDTKVLDGQRRPRLWRPPCEVSGGDCDLRISRGCACPLSGSLGVNPAAHRPPRL